MKNNQEAVSVSRLGLAVIVTLYLAHALPLYFYNVALPAILRSQGVDLRWIGMLSLLYLPWACKFLWAPFIDRYYVPALGRRRTWLWLTQIALVMGVFALAFTGLDYGLLPFVLIGLWISTFAATQDIAIDGYTVESLASADHRLGKYGAEYRRSAGQHDWRRGDAIDVPATRLVWRSTVFGGIDSSNDGCRESGQ